MRRSKWLGILAAATFALAGKAVVAADTLTILWAEWDPANYLQELVKDYEKQDRRPGQGRDGALAGFPDQGIHRVQRQGRRL